MHIEKVAIIGKGAVGLLYGSMIESALGAGTVEFVMDGERYARHADDAVTINGEPCGIATVPASRAQLADAVIVTIKTTGLAAALDTMEAVVGPQTRIASLCNGIRSERAIAERFGWGRTVLSVAQGMDAVFIGDAMTYTHSGEIRFGAAEGTEAGVVDDLADLYARAGISHTVETDIVRRLWTKLMLNVGLNQTCMVYGGTYGSVLEPSGEQLRCFVAAMREARAVAEAEGVGLTEADLSAMVDLVRGLDPAGMPSMAQDRVNGKLTEVEEFAGTIRELGRAHGIITPTNDWLYQRVRVIEGSDSR
ncbi:2-dehydropantoate 2-reductase [Paratractidigestivibacter sp.]|uniref:ketopantoate reductase family protein n=1 Tax=Paratractidigestivibacter sp. TaxID=2847316 RepID=UPI002ABDC13E|nr:2-dehydropantoate 2-reductase [Paratractidigestivibacter sp.]